MNPPANNAFLLAQTIQILAQASDPLKSACRDNALAFAESLPGRDNADLLAASGYLQFSRKSFEMFLAWISPRRQTLGAFLGPLFFAPADGADLPGGVRLISEDLAGLPSGLGPDELNGALRAALAMHSAFADALLCAAACQDRIAAIAAASRLDTKDKLYRQETERLGQTLSSIAFERFVENLRAVAAQGGLAPDQAAAAIQAAAAGESDFAKHFCSRFAAEYPHNRIFQAARFCSAQGRGALEMNAGPPAPLRGHPHFPAALEALDAMAGEPCAAACAATAARLAQARFAQEPFQETLNGRLGAEPPSSAARHQAAARMAWAAASAKNLPLLPVSGAPFVQGGAHPMLREQMRLTVELACQLSDDFRCADALCERLFFILSWDKACASFAGSLPPEAHGAVFGDLFETAASHAQKLAESRSNPKLAWAIQSAKMPCRSLFSARCGASKAAPAQIIFEDFFAASAPFPSYPFAICALASGDANCFACPENTQDFLFPDLAAGALAAACIHPTAVVCAFGNELSSLHGARNPKSHRSFANDPDLWLALPEQQALPAILAQAPGLPQAQNPWLPNPEWIALSNALFPALVSKFIADFHLKRADLARNANAMTCDNALAPKFLRKRLLDELRRPAKIPHLELACFPIESGASDPCPYELRIFAAASAQSRGLRLEACAALSANPELQARRRHAFAQAFVKLRKQTPSLRFESFALAEKADIAFEKHPAAKNAFLDAKSARLANYGNNKTFLRHSQDRHLITLALCCIAGHSSLVPDPLFLPMRFSGLAQKSSAVDKLRSALRADETMDPKTKKILLASLGACFDLLAQSASQKTQ